MKVLVLGASGATGRLLVDQLLEHDIHVVAIVRDRLAFTRMLGSSVSPSKLEIIQAGVTDLTVDDFAGHVAGCDAVCSCLGHNLSFKGLFGKPRQLVTDTVKTVVSAIEQSTPAKPCKLILMNTSGNSNRDIPESPPMSQRIVISLLRLCLPPHSDNENAADFLRLKVGQSNSAIEWVAVRPDTLTAEENVSNYKVYESPISNVIFKPGKTSRINVAAFMVELLIDETVWSRWVGRMPVLYNSAT